ncbi:OLE2 [Candida pseudojiufengensis]|uniref:OLE2 n=1 Tax=Candida pseudojiufengensis TaxID=497109 RepID=UPI002224D184|nr:OLE2 [Candida pseudojiufengensis]KAI5965300.1 OLE2 [Candida pseudojiufengensis]
MDDSQEVKDDIVQNGSGFKIQRRKIVSPTTSNKSTSTPQNLMIQASKMKNSKINEIKKRKRDFLKRINYTHTLTVVVLPALTLIYILYSKESILPGNERTLYFLTFYYNFTMLMFTAGYHKYFAHNSYKIRYTWLKILLAIFGSSLGLGSIRWWAGLHRAHHHFTDDTEKDPYSIKRGLLFSHYGWIIKSPKVVKFYNEFIEQEFPQNFDSKENQTIEKEQSEIFGLTDEFDLDEEDIEDNYNENLKNLLNWQQRTYLIWFFITTIIIPGLITKFICQDTFLHGIVYPGIFRMFLCQQSMLSTESICHYKKIQVTIPNQPFNDKNSSQNCSNPLVSLITYGQSHQNYHHEFPHDYRCNNSIFTYDPTKWFIYTLSKIGLVSELCKTPTNLVEHLKLQQQQEILNRLRSQLNWGTPISKLPLITPKDFKKIISSSSNKDRIYIVIQNIIHDITPFMDQHPGGVPLLKASHGKDATKAFYGGVYGHSTAAINLLATMRIGILDNGNDEEVWKRVVKEEGDVREVSESSRNNSSRYKTAEAA